MQLATWVSEGGLEQWRGWRLLGFGLAPDTRLLQLMLGWGCTWKQSASSSELKRLIKTLWIWEAFASGLPLTSHKILAFSLQADETSRALEGRMVGV